MVQLQWTQQDQEAVDRGRALAADAVQKAGNGHPGSAISLSPVCYLLFQKVMKTDPSDPSWLGRDRFVLSMGHSSLSLYNQLFLGGYGLELDDLKSLRTWNSLTPGHPEYGHTPGVEMTTGPLGQGLASAVGMAMAVRRDHGIFDPETPEGQSPFDHFVYVLSGEGCLEEGVTSEACSLAGTQHLGNLILIYDENQITIEDNTSIAFTEDVLARYAAYGWHTQHVAWRGNTADDYHEDIQALYDAILQAQAVTDKPSIIKLDTIMAWPSPTVQNSGKAHGAALGAQEVAGLKRNLNLDPDKTFDIPDQLLAYTRANASARGREAHEMWDIQFATWRKAHPERATLLERAQQRELPDGFDDALPHFDEGTAKSTRSASGAVLNALAPLMPELWGGSADLAGSTNTTMESEPSFLPEDRVTTSWPGNRFGRTLHFGIREHAMAAILNGISLDGLTRAYGGTFFVFADYMRPAVRMAAIMKLPSIFVWTHDSIGVGEDGPTHQPVEHLFSYRAIPGLAVVRPADANETAAAWKGILLHTHNPSGIVLTRQNVPVLAGTQESGVRAGGYVLSDSPTGAVDVQIIGTGSEVQLALEAQQTLAAQGIGARVISMPCIEWFQEQTQEYRDSVLLPQVRARVSVEAGSTFGWAQFVGDAGRCVGLDHYGASAPGAELFQRFGLTADAVVSAALESYAATHEQA
ncbi:MAG: transketolase [Actinomycetaceae bacterium]|nr:transketolase [Actinomycetaceae bacterium]MDY6083193.1 transketolase [Actinomycetaceae bacterium]